MKTSERKHEPLLHIAAREPLPWHWNLLIRAAGILAALLLCALLTWVITEKNPIEFAVTVWHASFPANPAQFRISFWSMLHDLAILLMLSLAVTPAFRMRFWNIGAEGQTLVGCLLTAICMRSMAGNAPNWLIILCSTLGAIAAGAVWGVIPAVFKARFGTNETLFTLMMNYIAARLVAYFWVIWKGPRSALGMINGSEPVYQVGWLPQIGNEYLLNILIAAVCALLMCVYLYQSKHGFELSVVGESQKTASYLGIRVGWVTVRTMLLSGAICGLTGLMITAGHDHTIDEGIVRGRGFTAVMVSWLAKFNPLYMILASFLIVFLQHGAKDIASSNTININESFSEILIGIILFSIIGTEFFIRYRVRFRHHGAAQKGGLTHV
ncbi:MAG: ABC transporter permease [Clostridia bacterium]|nr:ABC transporter permease [Clostridia bacterium]